MENLTVDIIIHSYGSIITDTGKKYNVGRPWWKPYKFTFPGKTKLVKINANKCSNCIYGGIIASFSNGVVTNNQWDCCPRCPCNQTKEFYFQPNKIPGIADNAKWIWTKLGNGSVCCTKEFGKCHYLTKQEKFSTF